MCSIDGMSAHNPKSDEMLIESCRAGDKLAFDRLIERFGAGVYHYILFMVKNSVLAEDIYQETWLRVYRNLPAYQEQGKFKSWLFQIANRQCLNHLRPLKRSFISLSDIWKSEKENSEYLHIVRSNPGLEVEIETKEAFQLLKKALKSLPLKQRQVFLLRMNGEFTFQQISQLLNRPLNTVLTQMRAALMKIRSRFREYYDDV